MNNLTKKLALASAVICAALFTGCAAKELRAGAAKVIVSRSNAPKSCKFLGTVVGEQGGSFTGAWTSNKKLAQGAMNDMKNNAFELGGNYVVLETNTAGNTSSGSWYSSHGGQTDVTSVGNAYKCPPSDIGLGE